MKMVGIRAAREDLTGVVEQSQRERVILTRHGKPAALLIGIAGEDLEEILLRSDEAFWRELAHLRLVNSTISSPKMRTRLGMPSRARLRRNVK